MPGSDVSESQLAHMCRLQFDGPPHIRRKTNIICTIGKGTRSVAKIEKLIKAGMSIVRLNFSHDSHEHHAETIKFVREASVNVMQELSEDHYVGIAVDTKGPEIRTGLLDNANEVELKKNDNIRLSINKDVLDKGTRECVYIDYPNIINVVQPGNIIYLNDGYIMLLVKEVAVDCVICQVEQGGMLGSRKGVCIPGVPLDLPPVSEKDRYDLRFAVENHADFVFASKVRHPSAIKEIRSVLGEKGKDIQIVAKIDGLQILSNLDQIIAASDGILIDRSDLGVEIPYEKIFLLQKAIIARCNRVGKPVVVGTQLLESMRLKPRPTRAEVADVANAVIDGVDGLMIASESAIGNYPIETVSTLATICAEAEAAVWHRNLYDDLILNNPSAIDAVHSIAVSAVDAAKKSLAACIVVMTTSGRSAYLVSMYRPNCPILAVTRCPRTARQAHLRRGLVPLLYLEKPSEDYATDVDMRLKYALSAGSKMHIIAKGDSVVVLSQWKEGTGFCNNMRVSYAFFERESIEAAHKPSDNQVRKTSTMNR